MEKTAQYPLYAVLDFTADDTDLTLKLPPGAWTLPGTQARLITALTGTTPTISLVDNASSPVTYISAEAAGSAGAIAVDAVAANNYYPAGGTLTISFGGTNPAGGRGLIAVPYVILGRQNEKVHG